ncbi:MAG: hypothetical protein GKR95_01970 [Gammaproteobacteria bacterium]|nr:hypothetical protein [Gammaproteobacteria bacterium]
MQNKTPTAPVIAKMTTHGWLAGFSSMASYLILWFLSQNDAGVGVFSFLFTHWLGALIVFGFWFYLRKTNQSISVVSLLLWALIFRIIGIFGSPVLEDDFYRYLLDGCVFIENGSPYGIAPQALFAGNNLSVPCQNILTWVNHPHIPTIYSPVLQYLFALASWISPGNVVVLQVIFTIFDLGLIILLLRLSSPNNVMLYAWCPLVIKEIAFTAHTDIVGIFFIFAALVSLGSRRFFMTALFSGLALATKVFALIVVPFLVFRLGIRYWFLTATIFASLYLPFLLQHQTDFFTLQSFVQNWTFNSSVFALVKLFLSDPQSRLLCLGIFAFIWLMYFCRFHWKSFPAGARAHEVPENNLVRERVIRGDWLFGLFFLLSPVFNPWYLIWLLPFAVIYPSYWAWTVATTASLSYLTGLNLNDSNLQAYEVSDWAWFIEYGLVFAAVTLDRIRHSKITRL